MNRASGIDLTGRWSGEFSYPANAGPTTPFVANLVERDAQLSGTIVEPDILTGAETIEAVIEGLRNGFSIDFTKTYGPLPPPGYDNPVDYVGSVTSDGNVITGVWSVLDLDGRFEMRREDAVMEELASETAEEIPVSASPTKV